MSDTNKKPGRPLGVTIAIIASVVVYSILPLLWIGMTLLIEQRLNEISDVSIPVGAEEIAPAASGGNIDLGVGTAELIVQTTLSSGFCIVALFAWRGRSRMMRYVFLSSVIALSISMIAIQVIPLFTRDTQGASGGSLDTLFEVISNGHILLMLLLPVYVVWYLNRGPARAFYRGYYLTELNHS